MSHKKSRNCRTAQNTAKAKAKRALNAAARRAALAEVPDAPGSYDAYKAAYRRHMETLRRVG